MKVVLEKLALPVWSSVNWARMAEPSIKLTLPLGVPLGELTFMLAVNCEVTSCRLELPVRAMVVGKNTCCDSVAETLALKLASPA